MMFNKLFLIGNGFDLCHGLQTKYVDFIKWYLNESVGYALSNNSYEHEDDCLRIIVSKKINSPVSAEVVKNELSNQLERNSLNINYVDNYIPNKTGQILRLETNSPFVYRILKNCLNSDWGGIEDEIYKEISLCHFSVEKEFKLGQKSPFAKYTNAYLSSLSQIKNLNKSVNCLKKNLQKYLICQNKPETFKDSLFEIALNNLGLNNDVLFLNFNYTTYYRQLIKQLPNFTREKFIPINIHGDVYSQIDDFVFGIGDEQNNFYHEIESQYDNDWLVCMKSFHYFRNQNYKNLLSFTQRGFYELYVLGHSCSITDRTLLNMLFENRSCIRIHVFHYNGINSYINTAYNISRNFKDKVKLRKVLQPYDPTLTM